MMYEYTVAEAAVVANTHKMDEYHRDLILWLCSEVRGLRKKADLLDRIMKYWDLKDETRRLFEEEKAMMHAAEVGE